MSIILTEITGAGRPARAADVERAPGASSTSLAVMARAAASGGRWLAWGGLAAVTLAFLLQPVSVPAQLLLAGCAIAAMTALWVLAGGQLARSAFLALGSLVVIRYVYWRTTSTLPSLGEPVSFTFGLLLLGAELYCVGILAISLVINAEPLVRAAQAPERDEDLPTVDVLVPSYDEDELILATTLAAAMSLDYPAEKLTVWLLDDGGTEQKCHDPDPILAGRARDRRAALEALCASLGARYLTRTRNEHAKAGNLNNGLRHARGEIVAVLDADHAPFRPFLRATIGHFRRDPKLFLVQTPHVFLNPDPIERNLRTFDRMPAENEMFYAVTQRGLDKWNGSFFCGSAALLRRAALESGNGFSGLTITEDCETALDLHAAGWTSVYVDTPLVAGLQPETFASFIGQRSRWCQGMFQILLLKNPLFRSGLSGIQRLSYLSSMSFWFFPLPRLAFMLAPLLYIFFDLKIFVSSLEETVAYTASYVVVNMMIQNYLYGNVRWPWMSELYEYVQGVYLAKAIVAVVASPRRPAFNVTAKGQGLDSDHLSRLAWPFVAIFGLLACGTLTAGYRYLYEPGVTALMLVVGLWTLFNLVIAGAALGVVAERRQERAHPRLAVSRKGYLEIDGTCRLVDIDQVSYGGCAIRHAGEGADLPRTGSLGRLSIVRFDGAAAGPILPVRIAAVAGGAGARACELDFAGMSQRDHLGLAELMFGDAGAIGRAWTARRRHQDLLRGSLFMLRLGVSEPLRALGYALKGTSASWIAARPAAEPRAVTTIPMAAEMPVLTLADPAVGTGEAGPAEAPVVVPVAPMLSVVVAPAAGPSEAGMAAAWMEKMLGIARHEVAAERPRSAVAPSLPLANAA